ncbi:RNA degradosome polyphosphate kinase [Alteraurantiacibacter aquimixticola]|uniref:Polyphosphate kinase n=1 Tax=Alteraurantiacibacter aquimixticola TaxID=2489173 RepID=A0A4T3EYM0_9SPHN|nr:RNA degradosome polyphosphate kinase [Alteraurantiacibacter aquimixticola]TIX49611.1 RNA degradosome polyphosphate kinase [Alteraurantiacibacter aquimixticola]
MDTATSTDAPDLTAPENRYFNRELSWLSFNERVLAEARNPAYPLLERLRFLSISGSNLDEFMMIRVAGLAGQVRTGVGRVSIDGKTPTQQLAAIKAKVSELERMQQAALSELRQLLAANGIHIKGKDSLTPEADSWLRAWFLDHIMPVITPQAIDPAHPFPFVANGGIGALFNLVREEDDSRLVEMVLVPSMLPRFVRVPGEEATYVAIERLICRYAQLLFPGFRIEGDGVFRVLRDSDIEVEEEAEDLVRYFRSAIQRRRRGQVIMLELDESFDPAAEELLRDKLGLEQALVNKTIGMIGVSGLAKVVDEDRPDLKFTPYTPRYPERVMEHDGDVFASIREKDIVIHHPYESFEVVVDFLRQAAADPAVVSIKQALYRAGQQSPVINALCAAAEAGKSVTAVVELKARFDEEQNLKWAAELERAGVQVIYGFIDWKTHAKISMVVREEEGGYRTYCHFGTGNYHPVTTKIYTDLSYFTADPAFGRDAARLFNFITGYVEPQQTELIAISPLNLRERLYEHIDQEIANAEAGKPAAIWAKVNSITEKGIIDRLYEASQAGVHIVLVVRGICCLRPGVPGLSDNISVKSIIGRFLEHSRIWAFANGEPLPSDRARIYISSADAMSRNLNRRVETLVPIVNPTVHDQVLEQVLLANLLDTEQSWLLDGETGEYERVEDDGEPFNCHDYFMTNPSLSGRGGALKDSRVPRLSLRKGGA